MLLVFFVWWGFLCIYGVFLVFFLPQLMFFSALFKCLYVITFYQCSCHNDFTNTFPYFLTSSKFPNIECKLCISNIKTCNSKKSWEKILTTYMCLLHIICFHSQFWNLGNLVVYCTHNSYSVDRNTWYILYLRQALV